MKTYTFKVVVEQDEDRWFAYCPWLEKRGASTWGNTRGEALKNIHEVLQMVIESMLYNRGNWGLVPISNNFMLKF